MYTPYPTTPTCNLHHCGLGSHFSCTVPWSYNMNPAVCYLSHCAAAPISLLCTQYLFSQHIFPAT